MSRRGTKAKRDHERRRQLRNMGYDDGWAGRPAKFVEAEYQTSYRRGREARELRDKQEDD
jgi:hypothetical protein